MDDDRFEEWASRLIIRGEQAFLPGEHDPAEPRRRRYHAKMTPERRAYKREWQRRYRLRRAADGDS